MATSRRLLQISKSNRIIREAVEEKREERGAAGMSAQWSEPRKNVCTGGYGKYSDGWKRRWSRGTPVSAPLVFPYGGWCNTSTSPKHLSLNMAVITTNTGAWRTA